MLSWLGCTESSIRVAGGSNSLEGRVEVCHDGVWGTVCDSKWDSSEAVVACRQLRHASEGNDILK